MSLSLNCQYYGIDDPRDVEQLINLTSLDLGNNPLNQVHSVLFSANYLPDLQYINVAPNDRFPSIEIEISTSGIYDTDLSVLKDNLIVNSQEEGDITNGVDIRTLVFSGRDKL